MNTTKAATCRSIYFPSAEGIRGLACIIVLITHAITMFFISTSVYLAGSGKIWVWLFFVLSDFLLTTKFKISGFSFPCLINYGVSRFLRIMPLYLFTLIIYKFLGTAGINSWTNVEDALFLKQAFAHLWTVPVEFKFYFYLPLIAFFFIKTAKFSTFGLVVSFIILISIEQFFWPYSLTSINSIKINYYLTPFTTGIFFSILYDRINEYITSKHTNWLGLATVAICFLSLPITKYYFFKMPLDLSLSNQFVYFGFLWAIFITFTLQGKGFFGKILSTSIFRIVGKWSYSIYLFHWFVYMEYIKLWPSDILAMFAAFISAILVGGIIFYFVEQPIEYLRQRTKDNLNWRNTAFIFNRMTAFRYTPYIK